MVETILTFQAENKRWIASGFKDGRSQEGGLEAMGGFELKSGQCRSQGLAADFAIVRKGAEPSLKASRAWVTARERAEAICRSLGHCFTQ